MAQKQQIDFSQFYLVLEKAGRRVTTLEKDASFIERRLNAMERYKKDKYGDLNNEMEKMKVLMNDANAELKKCIIEMIKLSDELKSTLKQEFLVQLSEKVDEIKFDEFVTKQDLKKKLNNI